MKNINFHAFVKGFESAIRKNIIQTNYTIYSFFYEKNVDYLINPQTKEWHKIKNPSIGFWDSDNLKIAKLENFIPIYEKDIKKDFSGGKVKIYAIDPKTQGIYYFDPCLKCFDFMRI